MTKIIKNSNLVSDIKKLRNQYSTNVASTTGYENLFSHYISQSCKCLEIDSQIFALRDSNGIRGNGNARLQIEKFYNPHTRLAISEIARTRMSPIFGEIVCAKMRPDGLRAATRSWATRLGVIQFLPADVTPAFHPAATRDRPLLSCYPYLDHPAGCHPVRAGQGGPCAADRFTSVIGGLLPIALCGRTSL